MNIPLLGYASGVSFYLPAILFIVRYSRLSAPLRLFGVYALLNALIVTAELAMALNHVPNHLLINFNFLLETAAMAAVFHRYAGAGTLRTFITVTASLYAFLWFGMFATGPLTTMNTFLAVSSRLILILLSVLTLISAVTHEREDLLRLPLFWLAGASLLYNAGGVLVLGFGPLLMGKDLAAFGTLWSVNWSLIILSNILFTEALRRGGR